jgi:hypothetical protein
MGRLGLAMVSVQSYMGSIPDKLSAVIYCDGDFSQIDAIKSSINLFTDCK